mgnify:CR=1 FL=1
MFNKATKQQSKLRLLLEGTAGSGKTYSALIAATAMGKKIAVIDTEKGSASLYSDRFDFDVCEILPPYTPESYIEAIKGAEQAGYDVLVIDSITHEWSGEGGCLDIQSKLGGKYQDWAKVTPRHDKFKEAILQSTCHVVATARTKTDYAMVESKGKMKVEKLGTKTEQREGLDFEFTTVLRINQNHMFESSKDRTGLFDGKEAVFTEAHGKMLIDWLDDGVDPMIEGVKKINGCSTLDELKSAWLSFPKHMHLKLTAAKDKRKSELEFEEDNIEMPLKEAANA